MPPKRRIIKLSPDVRAWEKQPGESHDDYERFKVYLELGDYRSLEQALEIWNATCSNPRKQLTLGTIKQYSSRFRWAERVGAFDHEQWAAERRRLIKLKRDALERHRKQGVALQGKGAQALAQIPVQGIGPVEALRFITEGAKLELTALGEPTQRVAHSGPTGGPVEVVDTSAWSPEDRQRRFRELLGEMAHRTGGRSTGADDTDDDQVV